MIAGTWFCAMHGATAVAQDGPALRGRVREELTAQPIDQAAVFVAGAGLVQLTTETGDFLLSGLPPGQHLLTVRRRGYRSRTFRFVLESGP